MKWQAEFIWSYLPCPFDQNVSRWFDFLTYCWPPKKRVAGQGWSPAGGHQANAPEVGTWGSYPRGACARGWQRMKTRVAGDKDRGGRVLGQKSLEPQQLPQPTPNLSHLYLRVDKHALDFFLFTFPCYFYFGKHFKKQINNPNRAFEKITLRKLAFTNVKI